MVSLRIDSIVVRSHLPRAVVSPQSVLSLPLSIYLSICACVRVSLYGFLKYTLSPQTDENLFGVEHEMRSVGIVKYR